MRSVAATAGVACDASCRSRTRHRRRRAGAHRKEARFTALPRHFDVDRLRAANRGIRPGAAPGSRGATWPADGQTGGSWRTNLEDLHRRLHRGSYRRSGHAGAYIPRRAAAAAARYRGWSTRSSGALNAIYETDLLGFSYGFPKGRGPHHEPDPLETGILPRRVNWVLDADIRDFWSRRHAPAATAGRRATVLSECLGRPLRAPRATPTTSRTATAGLERRWYSLTEMPSRASSPRAMRSQ